MKVAIIAIFSAIMIALIIKLSYVAAISSDKGNREKAMNSQDATCGDSDWQDLKVEALLESEAESTISGDFLRAFIVAYDAFKKDPDIPNTKKAIENYRVEFRQDTEFYYLTFTGSRKPGNEPRVGGESKLSKSALYKISKRGFRIVTRKFYK